MGHELLVCGIRQHRRRPDVAVRSTWCCVGRGGNVGQAASYDGFGRSVGASVRPRRGAVDDSMALGRFLHGLSESLRSPSVSSKLTTHVTTRGIRTWHTVSTRHAFHGDSLAAAAIALTAIATGRIGWHYQPKQPRPGQGWVVTLGDSAISGEAGRWAGNTNQASSKHDTGADAYFDNATHNAETTPGCHRSKAAQAHIGGGFSSLNLACSGARTYTQTGTNFKPGLDWYNGPAGKSQVVQLQEFAATNKVEVVTVMIGANNFGFADIVQQCVLNWATSPSWWKNYCYDDSSVKSRFATSAIAARTAEVAGALTNVGAAMANAGYQPTDYEVIIQTYWSPVPRGTGIRYSESGYTRQSVGGCGMWNRDADWANDTAVTKINQALVNGAAASGLRNYVVLDLVQALNGHRLCEKGVGLLEEMGLPSWTAAGAADRTEWVSQIRTATTIIGPYQLQEGIHSSYWGQLAMRNCLRQAFNGGATRGGRCVSAGGVNANGEPNMVLQ